MTAMSVDERVDSSTESITHLNEDFEIVCDTQAKIDASPEAETASNGFPGCLGHPAVWVAWSPNCCPDRPRYSLLCDICKRTYQHWSALKASVICAWCQAETGGPHTFTPLNKKA